MAKKGVIASLGDLFFTISPEMGGFARELTHGVSQAASSTMLTVGNAMEDLGKAMIKKFTLPLAVATAANVAQFQALDREIRSTLTLFNTAPSLIDETFSEMSAGITGVSEEIGGLETAIADGLYQAISAGIPKDNVFSFLETAQMAAIADKTADLTSSVDAITTMMNAFASEELSAAEASDILFAAVAQGKTTFGELGASIGRAAGIASAAGVASTEYAAAIAAITKPGLETSEAVSYLRAAITGILRPGEEMNAIFQEMGFASAEAAIPILGLQPAFQTVVDAAGGSTSKLQELIGSAEGVNAILSITGDKAGVFATALAATENSAGQTAAAFKIADAGVGRSFGKMTESFDRLGNMLGAWGSKIIQPFVEFITDVVDGIRKAFMKMEPVFEAFTALLEVFFAIINLPVIKQFVTAIIALGIAFGGLLGVLGPVVLAFGLVLKSIAFLKGIATITNLFVAFRIQGIIAAEAVQTKFATLGKTIGGKLIPVSRNLGTAIQGVSKKMAGLGTAALGGSVMLLGIAAAVAIAVIAYQKHKDAMERIRGETLLIKEGVDRLAESMEISLSAIGEIDFEGLGGDIKATFVLENVGMLDGLQALLDDLGEAAAKDAIISIGFEMLARNATPEEVMATIDALEMALGKDFNITIGMIVPDAQFDYLETRIAHLNFLVGEQGEKIHINPQIKVEAEEAAASVISIYKNQGYDAYVEAAQMANDNIEGVIAENAFADALMLGFEELGGRTYGFEGVASGVFGVMANATGTVDDAFAQIEEKIPYMARFAAAAKEAQEATKRDPQIDMGFGMTEEQLVKLAEAQENFVTVQADLMSGIPAVFQAASGEITAIFNEINAGILSSMPILDIYTGAITQNFDKWVEGQNKYQADIIKIAGLRQKLIDQDLPGAVLEAFDSASMGQQAWLATLGADELDTAIAEMSESYGAATTAVETTFKQEIPNAIIAAQELIDAEYAKMETKAADAGTSVGTEVKEKFEAEAKLWKGVAETYMEELAGVIGGTISGPTIGAPQFSTSVYNNTVNVTSTPSSNPGQAVSKGLMVAHG